MSLSFIFLSKLYFMNSNRTHGSALNPDDSLPLALSQLQGLTLGPEPAALTVMTQRKKIILNVESVKSQCQQTISDILPPSKEFLVSPGEPKPSQARQDLQPLQRLLILYWNLLWENIQGKKHPGGFLISNDCLGLKEAASPRQPPFAGPHLISKGFPLRGSCSNLRRWNISLGARGVTVSGYCCWLNNLNRLNCPND